MKRRLKRSFTILLFILCFLIFLCVFAEMKILPKSKEIARYMVKANSEMEISRTVYSNTENIIKGGNQFVFYETDNDGRITAIKINTAALNSLKTSVIYSLNNKISENNSLDLKIPLGTLMSSSFLSGRGPEISIRVNPIGSFSADTKSEFVSAGINQTKHRIIMNIKANLLSFIPFGKVTTNINTDVTISETIIVGNVPDYIRGGY